MNSKKSNLPNLDTFLNTELSTDSEDDEDFTCELDQEDDSDTSSNSECSLISESESSEIDKIKSSTIKNSIKSVEFPTFFHKNQVKNECKVCCVCLHDDNKKTCDELLECDSCGFSVHEGCYGISDNDSKVSNASNASTEPWFCNSCLTSENLNSSFDLQNYAVHQCELCPNIECGLLKETETGRFVHILCALYVPGVAYQDTDKLWPVVLDEIPFQRWGEQVCSLCDDKCLSRTGICIQCDAGLCKTYFHVTCAQSQGYLCDPMKQNENDPFLAYCKQHSETSLVKNRKTNYLAMISNFKAKKSNSNGGRIFLKNENKERYLLKLKQSKENYNHQKLRINQPLENNQKVPRMISTCPSALKSLLAKNILDNDTTSSNLSYINQQQNRHPKSITFSSDFVKYYFERENRMIQYQTTLNELKESQLILTKQEDHLQAKYDDKLNQRNILKTSHDQNIVLLKAYLNINKCLNLTKSQSTSLTNLNSILSQSEGIEIQKQFLDLSSRNQSAKTKLSKNTDQVNATLVDALCINCNKRSNFHLLIDCDTCKSYYHISCLSPPLRTVPIKTKLYGWECSKCVYLKDSDNSEQEERNRLNLDAPRSLRTKRPNTEILDYVSLKNNSTKKRAKKIKCKSPKISYLKRKRSLAKIGLNTESSIEEDSQVKSCQINSDIKRKSKSNRPSILLKRISLGNDEKLTEKLECFFPNKTIDTIDTTIDSVIGANSSEKSKKN